MSRWKPDPTFYPSPRLAAQAPAEELAYVVTLNTPNGAVGRRQHAVRLLLGNRRAQALDVRDPHHPVETGSVRLGGIVQRTPHPESGAVNGGPQMVEVSRDGKRIYLTNSLYASWDAQFYPEGIDGWLVKLDSDGPVDGFALDPDFFVAYDGERPHHVRLQGGDASPDSYCFA